MPIVMLSYYAFDDNKLKCSINSVPIAKRSRVGTYLAAMCENLQDTWDHVCVKLLFQALKAPKAGL